MGDKVIIFPCRFLFLDCLKVKNLKPSGDEHYPFKLKMKLDILDLH